MILSKPHKILGMSDFTMMPTGYGNQTRNIFKRLAKEPEFECLVMGCGYLGMSCWLDHEKNLLMQSPQDNCYKLLHGGYQPYGQDRLAEYFETYKPDVFWWLLDSFMVQYLINFNIHPIKSIGYFPSDGEPLVPVGIPVLKKMDYVVAMSKFGQAQALDEGVEKVRYIPHGVQLEHYHPLDKDACRARWSQRLGVDLRNKFIVGSVNRNQGRKALPELMRSFAVFAKANKDALLLFHCNPYDPASWGNLPELAKMLKIDEQVVYTGKGLGDGVGEPELAELYNCFDVHGSSTTGEGFGITTLEASACGIPNVITDCTTTNELVVEPDAGWGISVRDQQLGTYNVWRFFVDREKMAETFQYAKDNPSEVKRKSQNGLNFVRQFGWDTVYPLWKKLFQEVVEA